VYALYGLLYQYKECDNFPDYDSVELLRLYNERLSKKELNLENIIMS
jgi:hypothetical protein